MRSVLRSLREHKKTKGGLNYHGPCGSPDATAPGLVQGLRHQARGSIEQLVLAARPWHRRVMHLISERGIVHRLPHEPPQRHRKGAALPLSYPPGDQFTPAGCSTV